MQCKTNCAKDIHVQSVNAVDSDVLDSKNVGQLKTRGVNNSHAGLKLFPADILPISSCCTDMESKSNVTYKSLAT